MKVNQLQGGNTEVIRLGYFRTNVRLKSKSSLYETPGEKYPAVDEERQYRVVVFLGWVGFVTLLQEWAQLPAISSSHGNRSFVFVF